MSVLHRGGDNILDLLKYLYIFNANSYFRFHFTCDIQLYFSLPALMKQAKFIIALVAILVSVYFFVKRLDIIEEWFNLGISAVPIGQLLLPLILLAMGIVLLMSKKQEKNEM
jgi:hypothetical protein